MPPDLIFDCHVHLPSPGRNYTWEWEPFTSDVPTSIRYLRACGVQRILANTARGEEATSVVEMIAGNDEIADLAQEYSEFIVPACLVNTNFHQESLEELRRCHDHLGMVWVGELCGYVGGFSYDTPAFEDMVALATEMNMVVHIHNESAQDMDRLCRRFPKTTFLLAHLGESPEDVRARIELTIQHPHLHLDICGNGFERMGVLELAVRVAGADRVLYGSDFTINDPSGVIARILHSRFNEDIRRMILGGNLLRLLREHGATV